MKGLSVVLSLLAVLFLATGVIAADKAAISKNVDGIAAALDGGKTAADFKADAYTPYAFIMEQGGNLLVHPSLAGQNLKDKAAPVYEAVAKATPEGIWVDYEWQGAKKHSYVKKTKAGLIVGSGYSD